MAIKLAIVETLRYTVSATFRVNVNYPWRSRKFGWVACYPTETAIKSGKSGLPLVKHECLPVPVGRKGVS